ncbi:MAG: HNH endonuclease [Deltaproteobacteria bacterium]|nr:HNH endonuclease [Deltaproteobacteria bacterium]
MAFSESVVKQAWDRSGGRCECTRSTCGHYSRCNKELLWASRGVESSYGWEAHHITAGGPDTVSNCEILCQSCHKNTRTYGG